MNLLPISLAFILVFYYFCVTSWKDLKTTIQMNQAFNAFFEHQRDFFNGQQKSFYKSLTDPDQEKEKPPKPQLSKKRNKPFVYPREKSPPLFSTSKLNLSLLLSKKDDEPVVILLNEIALTLIRDLYKCKSNNFYYEGLEHKILTFIKETAKQHPNIDSLEEIFAYYSDNDPAMYKAFKGTVEYKLETGEGYPPLLDFISIKKGNSPIHFYSAHSKVLIAAFGIKIFEEIKAQELHKWKTQEKKVINEKELKLLLSQFVNKDLLIALQLIEFSDSIKNKEPTIVPEPKP